MPVSLSSLSDRDILSRTLELTRRERSLTLAVLLHLNEIERRRLHLRQGYASMFEYCTAGLGYSESAAGRRIRAARCIARFPVVRDALASNEATVSTVCQVAGILTPENAHSVLEKIRGKSQREVEAIVAGHAPQVVVPRDRVRMITVAGSGAGTDASSEPVDRDPALRATSCGDDAPAMADACTTRTGMDHACMAGAGQQSGAPGHAAVITAQSPCGKSPDHSRCGSDWANIPGDCNHGIQPRAIPSPAEVSTNREMRFVIQFTAGTEFMAMVGKLRNLAAHRLPANATFEQVFALAMEYMLSREDPVNRRARREKEEVRVEGTGKATQPSRTMRDPRHVPARVRDDVFVRDRGRCTYVGANGRKCGSMHALQVDHVAPVARGGASVSGNLRLLCAQHNRLEAERLMGTHGHGHGSRAESRGP
jgi:5-methylcytosine-specific restriction endonuclease McrA